MVCYFIAIERLQCKERDILSMKNDLESINGQNVKLQEVQTHHMLLAKSHCLKENQYVLLPAVQIMWWRLSIMCDYVDYVDVHINMSRINKSTTIHSSSTQRAACVPTGRTWIKINKLVTLWLIGKKIVMMLIYLIHTVSIS